jgi:arylsulfatase A
MRITVVFLILIAFIFFSFQKNPEKPKPVNVIILLADDLGYGDIGCYGSSAVATPNIDFLAKEGMKFPRFYAGSGVCSPSRASILSGLFPLRMNIRQAFTEKDSAHLPTGTTIIPELLKQKGYFTSFIGKWHLGGIRKEHIDAKEKGEVASVPGPLQQGFDHYLATIEGEPPRQGFIRSKTMYKESGKYLVRNDQRIPPINKQWDEIKVDEAVQIMDKCKKSKSPFFIEVAFDAPHEPYEEAPDPHLSTYKKMGITGDQLAHRSRISHLDAQIGRIYEALKQRGLLENTLVLFTSDNGPIHEGSSGPFEGGKTDLHEGGLRVPFIALWKGKIAAGTTNFSIAHHADILSTVAALAGVSTKGLSLDGKSMLSAFQNQYVERDQTLLFQMDKYPVYQGHGTRPQPHITMAAVHGSWKLTAEELIPKELFDLGVDYQEAYNLLGKHPLIENKLKDQLNTFWFAPRMDPYK